jgi:hypothetical protein
MVPAAPHGACAGTTVHAMDTAHPMQAILAVTIPFFALVLCGYLAARQRVLPETAIAGLNAFVLYFASLRCTCCRR